MKYVFEPKPDITVYELAIVLARVGGPDAPMFGVWFNHEPPESVVRHFRLLDKRFNHVGQVTA